MRMIAKAAGVALLTAPAAAHASMTGNEFLRLAETSPRGAELYASGFLDATAMTDLMKLGLPAETRRLPARICPPDRAEPQQVVDIIVRELRAKPEERHKPVPVIAWFALAQFWRCEPKP